jgi:hypothetical protein
MKRSARLLLDVSAMVSMALAATWLILWLTSGRDGITWHFTRDLYAAGGFIRQANLDVTVSPQILGSWTSGNWARWSMANIRVPFVALVLILSLPPLFYYRARRAQRPAKPGHCRACGYDLRATPERCPECGLISDAQIRIG